MGGRTRYLSLQTIVRKNKKKRRLFIIGGILTSIFLFGIIGGLIDYSEGLKEGIFVYIMFLIPSLILLFRGYLIERQIGAARRYESIFAADKDGIVTLSEISLQTGMNEGNILAELESLFRNGYFYNCTFQRSGKPCVIISDARIGEDSVGFITVRCENCGGLTRIRAGSTGSCNFCEALIKGTE